MEVDRWWWRKVTTASSRTTQRAFLAHLLPTGLPYLVRDYWMLFRSFRDQLVPEWLSALLTVHSEERAVCYAEYADFSFHASRCVCVLNDRYTRLSRWVSRCTRFRPAVASCTTGPLQNVSQPLIAIRWYSFEASGNSHTTAVCY